MASKTPNSFKIMRAMLWPIFNFETILNICTLWINLSHLMITSGIKNDWNREKRKEMVKGQSTWYTLSLIHNINIHFCLKYSQVQEKYDYSLRRAPCVFIPACDWPLRHPALRLMYVIWFFCICLAANTVNQHTTWPTLKCGEAGGRTEAVRIQ